MSIGAFCYLCRMKSIKNTVVGVGGPVRNSIYDYLWGSVSDSVRGSVWGSVRLYVWRSVIVNQDLIKNGISEEY